MKIALKYNSPKYFLILCVLILLVLLFSALNIRNYLLPREVLGIAVINTIEDTSKVQEKFWTEFLNKNPDYIPGWIENGRLDRVKEIDPNYFIH